MNLKFLQPQVSTVGLVAHYKLWAGLTSPVVVFDYSLNGNTGTPTGTNIAPAYPGFSFNGTDDFIAIPHDASLDVGDVLTFSSWVKRNGGLSANRNIIHKGTGTGNVKFGTTNKVVLAKTGTGDIITSNASITDALWHHIVVTKTGADSIIYIDGVDDTVSGTNQTLVNNTSALAIGSNSGGGARFFAGNIDDVMVFNIAKTAVEVKSIFELTRWRYGV